MADDNNNQGGFKSDMANPDSAMHDSLNSSSAKDSHASGSEEKNSSESSTANSGSESTSETGGGGTGSEDKGLKGIKNANKSANATDDAGGKGDKSGGGKSGDKSGGGDKGDDKIGFKEALGAAKDPKKAAGLAAKAAKTKGKDVGQKLMKKTAVKAGMVGGKYGALGMGAAAIFQKITGFLIGMLSMVLNSPVVGFFAGLMAWVGNVVGTVVSAVSSVVSAVGGLFGGISAAASSVIASVLTVGTIAAVGVGGAVTYTTSTANRDAGDTCTVKPSSGTTADVGIGQATGDWLTKGTIPNGNAQIIWDTLVQKHGFSGAGAAGVLAIAKRESDFDPAQTNDLGGVAGVLQWSGWSSERNGNRITSGGFITRGQASDLPMENEMKLMSYELNSTSQWSRGKYAGKMTDPVEAAQSWSLNYEGVYLDDPQSKLPQLAADAKAAYAAFGGAGVETNNALLGEAGFDTGIGGGGSTGAADGNTNIANAANAADCDTSDAADTADGSGAISEATGADGIVRWAKDAVPADVKQYIKDPTDAGLTWATGAGWFNPGNQCVMLSSSYFAAIWSGGTIPHLFVDTGANEADYWAQAMGGKASDTPHAGAIASVLGGVSGISTGTAETGAGHTWIVQHVLANGDIVIAEQNMPGLSGAGNGTTNTWNFGVISKAKYTSAKAKFFTPDSSKYKLSWKKA